MADFDANITMKLGNVATEAYFDPSVLKSVHDAYRPHTVYNDKGTPDLNSTDQVPVAPPEEMTATPKIGET